MDDQQTQRVEQAPMSDDAIQSRIDELIAELTPAEKAGQLTQYFYFGSIPETDAEQIAHRPPSEQAIMVDSRWDRQSPLLECGGTGLDHRRVDLQPVGRRRLDSAAVDDF
jgi:hypothetical protein